MPKLCLPIIESSKRAVLQRINTADQAYSFFEIWLDYIEDLDAKFVSTLVEQYANRLILPFRRLNLEPVTMAHGVRRSLCRLLHERPVYIDFDIRTQLDDLAFLREERIALQLICSYHNYKLTPLDNELSAIVMEMSAFNPTIFKLSTFCRDRNDALRLLALLLKLTSEGKRSIVLGMGEHGVIVRIFGSLWGNELMFAPQSMDQSSAAGQLTLQQLQNIFRELQ